MTVGLETVAAEQWLYSVLANDATLTSALGASRIYSTVVPPDGVFPCVLFALQDPRDFLKSGPYRVWTTALYVVRVIGQTTSYSPLTTAAARLDALLRAASGTVALGTVWGCVRERPYSTFELDSGGKQYRHLGGIYRVWVS